MIIEKFDFRAFFNTKNVTNNKRVKEYGIGAVSLITPRQAITRMTDPDPIYRIPGLGHHDFEKIAKKILGIKKEKSKSPEGVSLENLEGFTDWFLKTYVNEDYMAKRKEQDDLLKAFLDSVIKIEYTSNINFDLVKIKLPTFGLEDRTEDNKPKISDGMYEGINEILTELENSGLSSDSIKIEGVCSNQNYEQIKQFLKELVDSNFIFPFEENIIVEQQTIQEDCTFVNDVKQNILKK